MPGFGPRAAAWAARLSDHDAVLAADPAGAFDAAREAFVRRSRAPGLVVAPLFEDDDVVDARGLAAAVVRQMPGNDERRAMLDRIEGGTLVVNGKPQHETHAADVFGRQMLYFAIRLADTLVAGSWAEAAKMRAIHPTASVRVVRRAPLDPLVPRVVPDADADSIVVWAPSFSAAELAIVLMGLERIALPQIAVCAGGTVGGLRARFTDVRGAAAALRRAKVIVDAGPADAGTARTLGALGAALVAPRASGIDEWLDGVATFDARSRKSVELAARTALALPPPSPRALAEDEPLPAPPPLREHGPLVSVVIPTYNRRDVLPLALGSWERQTYRDLEIVVVNDAGPDVADVVARFPRARLVQRAENGRQAAACNTGIDAALGDAFVFAGDDDVAFPDHIARLVDALERSGAPLAHAEGAIVHVDGGSAVSLHGFGFGVDDMAEHDVANAFYPPHAILARREAVQGAGYFDPSLRVAEDYDYWVRLAAAGDVVHVPLTTCGYAARSNASHASMRHGSELPAAHAAIYARHPRPDRPLIEAKRKALLDHWANSGAPVPHAPPTWRFRNPIPLAPLFTP